MTDDGLSPAIPNPCCIYRESAKDDMVQDQDAKRHITECVAATRNKRNAPDRTRSGIADSRRFPLKSQLDLHCSGTCR